MGIPKDRKGSTVISRFLQLLLTLYLKLQQNCLVFKPPY